MTAAAEILHDLSIAGIHCSIVGDRVALTGNLRPDLVERARASKTAILARLRIETIATEACRGAGNVTPVDVLAALAPEDFADFEDGTFPAQAVRGFVLALSATRWRQDGIAPPGWDKAAHCDGCGDVYLWASIRVAGCPWCWNRRHGVKIPRPPVGDTA